MEILGSGSKFIKLKHGVLWGSILGPLFFIIYKNAHVPLAESILYADDMTLLFGVHKQLQ